MHQDPIETVIGSVALRHGFRRLKKHKWQLALPGQITAGFMMYGLRGVPAGMKQSELVFSLAHLPSAQILNWSPQGLRRSGRDPHPSLTWNVTRRFPEGELWHAVLHDTHQAEEIAKEFDAILGKYFVPFVLKHGSRDGIAALFEGIGGWAAFQFHFASLILSDGTRRIGAKAVRIGREYGVPASSVRKLVQEYADIPVAYIEKAKKADPVGTDNDRAAPVRV